MTRKDYKLIAECFKQDIQSYEGDILAAIEGLARELARQFAKENPQFDFKKFYQACGLE